MRYLYMFLLFGLGIYMLYDYMTKDKRLRPRLPKSRPRPDRE